MADLLFELVLHLGIIVTYPIGKLTIRILTIGKCDAPKINYDTMEINKNEKDDLRKFIVPFWATNMIGLIVALIIIMIAFYSFHIIIKK